MFRFLEIIEKSERPASPAAQPNLPRQRRRASCRLVNAFVIN